MNTSHAVSPLSWSILSAIAVVFLFIPAGAPAASPDVGVDTELRRRAAQGDVEAAKAIEELDAFLARTGANVLEAEPLAERVFVGGLPVTVNGVFPFWLNANVDVILETEGDVRAYRAARQVVIDRLATELPGSPVTFRLTPTGHRSIADVWTSLRRQGVTVSTLMLDVFAVSNSDRQWLSRFTHHAPDESGDDFLAADPARVESSVRSLLAAAHAGEAWFDVAGVEFEVFLVRGTAEASAVQRLARDPIALMVDPEADLFMALRDRATRVRVATMPTVPDSVRWSMESR